MGRSILGIALGIVAAFASVWGIDLVGHQIYPVPSDVNMRDFEEVGAFIRTMPPGALVFVVLAWFIGALDGGIVAVAISRRHWTVWLIAALVACAGILNVLMIPHPLLLQLGAVAAPLLGGFVAGLVGRRIVAARADEPAV